MPGKSPFADDWRECLRAHYQYVVRANDRRTLETLTRVLHQVGFGEDELGELYVRATMHVDETAEDFTPDMTVVAAIVSAAAGPPAETPPAALIAAAEAAAEAPSAAEVALAAVAAMDEPPFESDPDAYGPGAEPAFDGGAPSGVSEASEAGDEPRYDPDGPQQMSLF